MLGNWAMGSPDMATAPRMTMKIEITMATIGRLMKNFDMAGYLLSGAGAGAGAGAGLSPESFGTTVMPSLTF